MDSDLLRKKWGKISSSTVVVGYRAIRITDDCLSDIYLGIDDIGRHCLILGLPKNHGVQLQTVKKEKISIELFHDTNYLIMTLIDDEYNNLFDDLIVSLFNAIRNIEQVSEYSKVFIRTFYQWVLFFTSNDHEKVPKNLVKGLWGELLVLRDILTDTHSSDVNRVLTGWVGPYDQGHDFVYDDENIEVKTKDIKKVSVRISSEHQLEIEQGKKLTLCVVSVEDDLMNGISLRDLVQDIKALIFDLLGDFTIVLKALSQKGITPQNIQEYENYRFNPLILHDYDCLAEGFPKIVSANLPSEVSNVRYELNLSDLSDYLVSVREC